LQNTCCAIIYSVSVESAAAAEKLFLDLLSTTLHICSKKWTHAAANHAGLLQINHIGAECVKKQLIPHGLLRNHTPDRKCVCDASARASLFHIALSLGMKSAARERARSANGMSNGHLYTRAQKRSIPTPCVCIYAPESEFSSDLVRSLSSISSSPPSDTLSPIKSLMTPPLCRILTMMRNWRVILRARGENSRAD
jgi:hypothetical protein